MSRKRSSAESVTLTPFDRHAAVDLSKRTFRKQILPLTSITYEGKRIRFDRKFLTDLAESFKANAYDAVPFVLADPRTNAHNMDPERVRGEVIGMEVTDTGLDGIIRFPDAASARAVSRNPKLGVSARIVQGLARVDGKTFGRAIQHVLGTIDPRVTGMGPWTEVSLSGYTDPDVVLDLTSETYEREPEMGKKASKTAAAASGGDTQIEDIDLSELSDEEFQDMLDMALTADDDEDEDEDPDDVEDSDETDDESDEDPDADEESDDGDEEDEGEGTTARRSKKGRRRQLATASLSNEHRRRAARTDEHSAVEAMRIDLAERNWKAERRAYAKDGVPPALLDLAAPLLSLPDEAVIDLSNTDKPVNASAIVRGFLDEVRGLIDFKPEMGDDIDLSEESTSTADKVLAQWAEEYPI